MSRTQFIKTLSILSLSTTILAGPLSSLETAKLKETFSAEPESIRLFRARGMLNKYYKMRRSNSPKATAYLAVIVDLFPEVPRARLEWVFELQRKGDLIGAYHYLTPLQNQFRDNEKIQLTLAEITARLGDTKQARQIITPFLKSSDRQTRENTKPYLALISYEETKMKQAIDQYDQLEKKNAEQAKIYLSRLKTKYPLSTLIVETKPKQAPIITRPSAPIFIVPTIKAPPTENDLMNNYYALKKAHDPSSYLLLKKISSQYQNDFDAQMEMGYALLAQHKNKEALPYFLRAQQIRPDDLELANQIGFIECNIDQQKKAYEQFYNATKSTHAEISSQAHVALINLSDWKFKYLPDPWFFEFYTEPYYTSRFNDFIDPLEARLGAALGRYKQFWAYLSYRRSSDTASITSGAAPQIYNDNVGVIAGGTRLFPIAHVPWFFYAEYGAAYNLKQQLNEPTWRQDFRGGSTYGQQWGAPAAYDSTFITEFKPWTDVYTNLSYYSRYSNWIGQARQRIGARVFRWQHTTVSTYLMGQIFFDSQHLYYNNVIEYGPGIVLQPYNIVNFAISYEHLFGNYIPTENSGSNPYGTHYQTNIIRAQFFIRI